MQRQGPQYSPIVSVLLAGVVVFLTNSPSIVLAEDHVEFLSGAKARGAITEIRKAEKEFDLELMITAEAIVRASAKALAAND